MNWIRLCKLNHLVREANCDTFCGSFSFSLLDLQDKKKAIYRNMHQVKSIYNLTSTRLARPASVVVAAAAALAAGN